MISKKCAAVREAATWTLLALATSPAFAQLEKANKTLSAVQAWLLTIAVTCVTLATMFVGFRMLFQAAQWKDVAPVFWGAILIGSAPAIATLFIS